MKIIVLENNIKNSQVISSGIAEAVRLLTTIGYSVNLSYKNTNVILTSMPLNTDVVYNGFGVNYQPIADSVTGQEDIACMIYDATNIVPKPTNPNSFGVKKGNCTFMQIPEFWYGGQSEVLTEFFLHELCHCEYFLNNKTPDLTHFKYDPMWNGQFSQKSNIDYYLFLLKQFAQPMTTYKYFKPSEIVGLKPQLVSLLDTARGIEGIPFKITSGLRTVEQNKSVGGVSDSAHLTGEAVDLACSDSVSRFKMVSALLKVGFTRIEIAPLHIHVDISTTLPQNVMFLGSD